VHEKWLRWVLCDVVQTLPRHSFKICGFRLHKWMQFIHVHKKTTALLHWFSRNLQRPNRCKCRDHIPNFSQTRQYMWKVQMSYFPPPKVWPLLCHIAQNSQSLNKVLWTPTVPGFIQIRRKTHKILTTFNLQP
jgi:hypothetical protein